MNYQPDNISIGYDKFGEVYTGYDNGIVEQDNSLGWRILNINKDEDIIELISDKPTSTAIHFKGARAYNNGVALLNDYCSKMYSNKSKGAIARSLNIEDIQNKMKVDVETGKKAYENYTSPIGTLYGTGSYTYSTHKWYPTKWKDDRGVIGESDYKDFNVADITQYTTDAEALAQETTTDLIVTQTHWALNSSIMSDSFELADTRDISKSISMYYELLFDNGVSCYWVASNSVESKETWGASFCLGLVYDGALTGHTVIYSSALENSNLLDYYVRPVVSIPAIIIDISTEYNPSTGWSIK